MVRLDTVSWSGVYYDKSLKELVISSSVGDKHYNVEVHDDGRVTGNVY